VPAPWEAFEEALNRKERRSTSFIWYSIAAGVLLVFSAAVVYLGIGSSSGVSTTNAAKQPNASTQSNATSESKGTSETIVSAQSNASAETNASFPAKEIAPANSSIAPHESNTANHTTNLSASEDRAEGSRESLTPSKEEVLNAQTPPSKDPVQASHLAQVQTPQQPLELTTVPSNTENSVSSQARVANAGMAWMMDAAGFEIQVVELGADFSLAQLDLAKLNREFESSDLNRGSLSDLSSSMDLGKWWLEVSADQNQTGLSYRTPADLSQYVHKNFEQQMKQGETSLSAARFQLAVNMFIAKNSSVKIGLAYAQNRVGQNFNFRDSMPAVVSAGQTPDAYGNYPIFGYLGLGPEVKYNGSVSYSFVSVPIGWSGYMPIGHSKTLFFTPELLIQPNWVQLSSGAQTLDYQTLLLRPMDAVNYRAWVMSARVAAGIQKRLNYKHAIGAKWNAQGVLNSMNTANSPIQTRGWSSGLTLYYSFKID